METARQRIEALFDAALELPDATGRAALLERECMGDAALRARVERLLAVHREATVFFDDCRPALSPAESGAAPGEAVNPEEELGRRIGAYKLLQKIGEGGCGVVYLAEQEKPVRRRVALKIIKLGMDTKTVIARFEAERQALALMDHPNIARVLDAGATETGRPYFVMELVPGIRITEYCDERQLDTRQRLELFIQVCHAIQHAHQKGIIHRDIKPSNILVTHHDGVAVPKVIDFGIAKAIEEKLTDKTLFTLYGNFIGTPAYMSPEQADFSGLDIDTRSDIYSLGVLLYELLTGKPPFEQTELLASGLDEMRKTLREREPHRPSTKLDTLLPAELTATALQRHIEPPRLRLLLKGDLDWIVMKALEKDRRRRYETANALAMDARRFLDNEPVLARSPGRWYRFQKLVQRNRGVFAAAGAVALALVIGLGTATWLFFKEREMRRRAVAAEQMAERSRANEAELRRQAETREKITQARLLINQGKLDEADQVAAKIVLRQPTLEGAAVLRALGEWHALNGRWQLASDRFSQVLQVNQLDNGETVSRDFLGAGAALAAAGNPYRFESFRQQIAVRFSAEKNSATAARALAAGLLLPAQNIEPLRPLAQTVAPPSLTSIGNADLLESDVTGNTRPWAQKLTLRNVGATQPETMRFDGDTVTFVAGGADIWKTRDEFAYACASVAGDFDFRMQVCSVTPKLDNFTRVGLMAREAPDSSGSRHVMVAVNAENSFQVVMRSAEGAESDSVPHNPLPMAHGSNSWVRLQRVGAIFHAYTSSNGVDWVQLYQTTGGDKPFSNPIYFGIAATSHDTNAVATSVVCHFGLTPTVSANVALTLALWEYRSGNCERAAAWCRQLLAYPECNAVGTETARVILALAGERSNQFAETRRQLERAGETVAKKFSNGLEAGNQAEGYWYDWVFARTLLDEAQTAIR
jgi:eukaryotic-like serine/threonine-protein kinase